MKWLVYIMCVCLYSCTAIRHKPYSEYRKAYLGDTTYFGESTLSILLPLKISDSDVKLSVYKLVDIADLKRQCYKNMSYSEFDKEVVQKAFLNRRFGDLCKSLNTVTVVVDEKRLKKRYVKNILDKYFINGRSKSNYEGGSPQNDFYAGLITLFRNYYFVTRDDMEYFGVKKAPKNKRMRKLNQLKGE
ncbi:MAG: hypothetical protein EOP56_18595 [Sphingobacteriales bacterium]|nr:MAG: hypothetical protein EOP56_18595 [Sphingobacteriales bacterium]